MKLESIELYNIGPYRGKNKFNFKSHENQNTILFGGRNGSGKTTLLTSVRLGLYGSLGYGFRTNSDTYLQSVKDLLNDDTSKDDRYSIKIAFSLTNHFETNQYLVERIWKYSGDQIKEYVQVYSNGTLLSSVEMDNFFELLKSQFAPTLMELCFFDGEETLNIANNNLLSQYIKNLSYNLFDIDLYNSLERSLEEYLFTTIDSDQIIELKKEVDHLNKEVMMQKQKIATLQNQLEHNTEKILEYQAINEQLEEQFLTHGGLFYDQKIELEQEIYQIEHERKEQIEEIKFFISTQMPFYLVYNLFHRMLIQLNNEKEFLISKELSNKIEQLPIKSILNKLNISLENEATETVFKSELIDLLTNDNNVEIIHNLSSSETNRIVSLGEQLTEENLKSISKRVKQVRNSLRHLRELKNNLEQQHTTIEFRDLLEEINNNNERIQKLEGVVEEFRSKIEIESREFDELTQRLFALEQQLSDALRQKGSLSEAKKAVNVVRQFTEQQLWNKVSDIEYLALLMINRLSRKSNYISSIKIDPKTFEIALYNEKQHMINKNLSAGEKQLLVLALFWATVKASQKQVPIILDTLLGRLDSIHSQAIIDTLIPEFGDQVIILATDTEINKELYDSLKEIVSMEYTLEYITEERRTEVTEGFFDF